MEFRTIIDIPRDGFSLSHTDTILLMGSCFTEHMGYKLEENKFRTDINPFGTLYNPSSIASSLNRLIDGSPYTMDDLVKQNDLYHSFSHHSRFSADTEEETLNRINERFTVSSGKLAETSILIVTFGTSYVYRLTGDNRVVANCHKFPEATFSRNRLTVEEIVNEWIAVLALLWVANPSLKVLFTVSPIRHLKDGAHENQISKSILLLAIDQLNKHYPEQTFYFPSYEIMMDELRDYRFYAEDMVHPSGIAIEYIWEQFMEYYLPKESKSILKEWENIKKAINHKPFQPQSKGYKDFMMQTLLKTEQIARKFPYFDVTKEIELLLSKIKV